MSRKLEAKTDLLLASKKLFRDETRMKGSLFFHSFADGYELPSDGRQKVFPNGTLTISAASKTADEGYYTCTAFNRRDESDSGNVHIQVSELFSIFPMAVMFTMATLHLSG